MSEMVTGYSYLPGDLITLQIRPCPSCGKPHEITVNQYAYEQWADGIATLQEAFPEKTPAELELLLTGIDGECWLKHVAEPEEGEEGS